MTASRQRRGGLTTERSCLKPWAVLTRVKSLLYVYWVVLAVMQELKEVQTLFDEPNTETRKREHQEAQSYDDKTLLEEMRTTIKTIISEDSTRYVSMYRLHFLSPLTLLADSLHTYGKWSPLWTRCRRQ